ncbi:MAG: type II toxin-antitoxin system VapC family toxin [Ilumatobacteraceae bacterium]
MQVFDASAVVAALIDNGAAGRWCASELTVDELAAPHLLPVEVTNIVRRTEARAAVDRSTATQAIHDLRRLAVDYVGFDPLAERVWSLRANLTAYDACYVALAELVGGRLVTLDRRLARASGIRCPVVVAP